MHVTIITLWQADSVTMHYVVQRKLGGLVAPTKPNRIQLDSTIHRPHT